MSSYLRKRANSVINIVDIFNQLNIPFKIKGDNVFIHCFFHQDSNPSCSISPTLRLFHCFGCQVAGDLVYLLSRIRKKQIDEIIHEICLKYDIRYPQNLQTSLVNVKSEEVIDLEEELEFRRLKFQRLCDILIQARRLVMINGVFSDEMAFFYQAEQATDLAELNLKQCERSLFEAKCK